MEGIVGLITLILIVGGVAELVRRLRRTLNPPSSREIELAERREKWGGLGDPPPSWQPTSERHHDHE